MPIREREGKKKAGRVMENKMEMEERGESEHTEVMGPPRTGRHSCWPQKPIVSSTCADSPENPSR